MDIELHAYTRQHPVSVQLVTYLSPFVYTFIQPSCVIECIVKVESWKSSQNENNYFLPLQLKFWQLHRQIHSWSEYFRCVGHSQLDKRNRCLRSLGEKGVSDAEQRVYAIDCCHNLIYNRLIDWLIACLTVSQHRKVNLCQLLGKKPAQLAKDGQRDTMHI